MSEKIKNYLGVTIIAVVLIFAAGYLFYVAGYMKSVQSQNYHTFSVSGEGKVTAVPDIAQFSFSVITEGGTNIASLQSANNEKTNTAIAFLKEQGIDSQDIKTRNYNLSPRYQTYDCSDGTYYGSASVCPPSEIVGYTITQTISVKIRDFTKIGDILTGVITAGANSVSQLSFTIDDQTALENEARAEAIANAKVQAEEMAIAAGFKIGKLVSINEGYSYNTTFASYDESSAVKQASGGGATIEAGSQEITANITIIYEIKD
jgi:hypothetical protein